MKRLDYTISPYLGMGRPNQIYVQIVKITCFHDDVAKTNMRLVKWS